MPRCPRCGEANSDRARFCEACGAQLLAEAAVPLQVRKTVTVVFCDVTGSTMLGEHKDPESLRQVMSRYFEEMRTVIERHGGTVEKFVGDAVMAVFGVPQLHEDDAYRAVRAALEMRSALGRLNEELERVWGLTLAVRIGINTGEVVAGDPSSAQTFVTGDAVNVAKRLEEEADAGEILIGETTYRLVRSGVEAEALDALDVKGKRESVRAFRLREAELPTPHPRRLDSPMVGRNREQALLQGAFLHAVSEQTCHLATVLGAAGVGKSRLVREVISAVREQATVVVGRCLPYGEGITFSPVTEVVREAAGLTEDDDADAAREKLRSVLEGEQDATVADRLLGLIGFGDAPAASEETFWAVRRFFEALARRQPLVVVFDDVHWAEPTFLDLIEHVADWSRAAPILLVCLARPELLDLRPMWAGGKLNASSVLLEPLAEGECERLIDNLLAKSERGRELRLRIAETAEGNPLFVEEMLSMLIDDGVLERDNGHWVATVDLQGISVPPTIQALLGARLDRLRGDERAVIERGAVEGKIFRRGTVVELSADVARPRVEENLMTLVRKELIRPDRSVVVGEDAFRFRHILIRDAAYEAMPKQVRAELHERFADWLERSPGEERDETVGYHLEQAFRYRQELGPIDDVGRGLAARAAERLSAAGCRAFGGGDMPAAAALLGRALALPFADERERLELLPDLGAALRETGDLIGADEVLGGAIEAASAADDARLEARALIERASLRLYTEGKTQELVEVAERSIAVFAELGDQLGLAKAWRLLAQVHWMRGRFAAMEEVLERALIHARNAGDEQEESVTLNGLGRAALLGPTPVEEGIRRCEEIAAVRPDDRTLKAVTDAMTAGFQAMQGRFEEARERYGSSRTTYEDLGLRGFLAALPLYSGPVEMLAGEWEAAEDQLRWACDLLEEMGDKGRLSSAAAFLARTLAAQGRYEEAEGYTVVSEEAAAREDVYSQVAWRRGRAEVLAARGELERAETLVRKAVKLVEETDALNLHGDALMDLAEVLRAADRAHDVVPCVEKALALYEAKGNVVSAGRAKKRLSELDQRSRTR